MPQIRPVKLLPHQTPPVDVWGEWELVDPDPGAGTTMAGAYQMARILVENPDIQIVLAGHDLRTIHQCMLEPILGLLGIGQATGLAQNAMAIEGRRLLFLTLLDLERVRGQDFGAVWFNDVGGHGAIREAMEYVRYGLRRAPGQIVMTGRTPYSRHSVARGKPIEAPAHIPRPRNPPPTSSFEVA